MNVSAVLQVTDYAIARRIVDLHSHVEESVERVYSLEEIQRYIMFARQFKPRLNKVWKLRCWLALLILLSSFLSLDTFFGFVLLLTL